MLGLDTSAIIDLLKNDQGVVAVLGQQDETVATCMMNYAELLFGVDPTSRRGQEELNWIDAFFNETLFLHLSKKVCKRASMVQHQLKRQGKLTEPADVLIAAAYLEHGIDKLLTRNKKHFEHIKGLRAISY
jgi:predicted nucleic acid-binding protein